MNIKQKFGDVRVVHKPCALNCLYDVVLIKGTKSIKLTLMDLIKIIEEGSLNVKEIINEMDEGKMFDNAYSIYGGKENGL